MWAGQGGHTGTDVLQDGDNEANEATADLGKVAEARNGPCLRRGMVAVPCHMLGQYRGPLRRQELLWQVSPVCLRRMGQALPLCPGCTGYESHKV